MTSDSGIPDELSSAGNTLSMSRKVATVASAGGDKRHTRPIAGVRHGNFLAFGSYGIFRQKSSRTGAE